MRTKVPEVLFLLLTLATMHTMCRGHNAKIPLVSDDPPEVEYKEPGKQFYTYHYTYLYSMCESSSYT